MCLCLLQYKEEASFGWQTTKALSTSCQGAVSLKGQLEPPRVREDNASVLILGSSTDTNPNKPKWYCTVALPSPFSMAMAVQAKHPLWQSQGHIFFRDGGYSRATKPAAILVGQTLLHRWLPKTTRSLFTVGFFIWRRV